MEVAATAGVADFSGVDGCQQIGLIAAAIREAGARFTRVAVTGASAGFHYIFNSNLGNKYASYRHIYWIYWRYKAFKRICRYSPVK